MEIKKLDDDTFEVRINELVYKVTLDNNYHGQLTDGKISKEDLIKKSFEYLLKQESPEYILKEFDIKVIANFFPNFPDEIKQSL